MTYSEEEPVRETRECGDTGDACTIVAIVTDSRAVAVARDMRERRKRQEEGSVRPCPWNDERER